jgi:HEAT repeat protein
MGETFDAFEGPAPAGTGDDDFHEFWEIVQCMGQEGWESAIAAWEAADKRRSDALAESIQGATSLTPDSVGRLEEAVSQTNEEHHGPDGKPAISLLIELLQDPDERVRFMAVSVLGGIGGDARCAVPALKELINDESAAVCRVAAKALRKIESEKP